MDHRSPNVDPFSDSMSDDGADVVIHIDTLQTFIKDIALKGIKSIPLREMQRQLVDLEIGRPCTPFDNSFDDTFNFTSPTYPKSTPKTDMKTKSAEFSFQNRYEEDQNKVPNIIEEVTSSLKNTFIDERATPLKTNDFFSPTSTFSIGLDHQKTVTTRKKKTGKKADLKVPTDTGNLFSPLSAQFSKSLFSPEPFIQKDSKDEKTFDKPEMDIVEDEESEPVDIPNDDAPTSEETSKTPIQTMSTSMFSIGKKTPAHKIFSSSGRAALTSSKKKVHRYVRKRSDDSPQVERNTPSSVNPIKQKSRSEDIEINVADSTANLASWSKVLDESEDIEQDIPKSFSSNDAAEVKSFVLGAPILSSSFSFVFGTTGTSDDKKPLQQEGVDVSSENTTNKSPLGNESNNKTENIKSPSNRVSFKVKSPKGQNLQPPTPLEKKSPLKEASDSHKDETNHLLALAETFRKQGREFYQSNSFIEALDAFNKALQYSPDNWIHRCSVLSNRSATQVMLGNFFEAIDDCDVAINLNQCDIIMNSQSLMKLYNRRGRVFLRLGDLIKAGESFKHVISISSNLQLSTNEEKRDAEKQIQLLSSIQLSLTSIRQLAKIIKRPNVFVESTRILQLSNEVLQTCTHFREVQIAKIEAMLQLGKFQETKTFIEEVVLSSSSSMLGLTLFPSLSYRDITIHKLPLSSFSWAEGPIKPNTKVFVDIILHMGHELAKYYIRSLKNMPICRYNSAAVIDAVVTMVNHLFNHISNFNTNHSIETSPYVRYHHYCSSSNVLNSVSQWLRWISEERSQQDELVSFKNEGDDAFRLNRFKEAIQQYTQALDVDDDAIVWNAILYSNRAAAHMALRDYSKAIQDCNKAIALDGHYMKAYLRRARAYKESSDYDKSLQDYEMYLSYSYPSRYIPRDLADVQEERRDLVRQLQEQKTSKSRFGYTTKGFNCNDEEDSDEEIFYQPKNHNNYGKKNYSNPYTNSRFQGFQQQNSQSQGWRSGAYANFKGFNQQSSSSRFQVPPKIDENDPYNILKVSLNATERDIKIAYRKLALQFHPDKNKEKGAEDMFKKITSAYAILSDKNSRQRYDLSRP